MSLEWKSCKIGDVVSVRRGASPRPIKDYVSETGMPWVKIADATKDQTRFINFTGEFIKEDGIEKSVVVNPGDLIVSNSATPGLPKFMNIKACVHDGWLVFDNYDGILKEYLYYYFIVVRGRLVNQANGSVFKNLKTDIVRNFDINLPDLETQQKIVNILSQMDKKIEVNIEINKNLLQLSKVIFKNWFVEFGPFSGIQPEDWKISTLEEVCDLKAGGDKPNVVSDEITDICIYPIYSNGLDKDGLYGYTDQAKIFEESVTVSARGTIGFVCLRHVPYVPIVRLVSVIPKKEFISAKYLYLFLDRLNIMGTGTTQQQLTLPDFKKTEILVPTLDVIESFTNHLKPIFEKIWIQEEEIKKLSKLRDTLLPKLMSGEIDVSKINCDLIIKAVKFLFINLLNLHLVEILFLNFCCLLIFH